MFERVEPSRRTLNLRFEDQPIAAQEGDSVAAALLAANVGSFRDTPVSGAPRGPYCMMGVCFDCLIEIDGVPNRQACLTAAVDGMVIRRQRGARELAP
jgi:predicted molibdopterin-dependent oxidoreductase YjgC